MDQIASVFFPQLQCVTIPLFATQKQPKKANLPFSLFRVCRASIDLHILTACTHRLSTYSQQSVGYTGGCFETITGFIDGVCETSRYIHSEMRRNTHIYCSNRYNYGLSKSN